MAPKSDVNSWEARAERKRNELASTIPKEWHIPADVLSTLRTPLEANKNDLIELDIVRRSGILTERELDITENHNVASLLQRLASGEFTCVEVTAAFSKRAAIAQQLVCPSPPANMGERLTLTRRIASPKPCLSKPRPGLKSLTLYERAAS